MCTYVSRSMGTPDRFSVSTGVRDPRVGVWFSFQGQEDLGYQCQRPPPSVSRLLVCFPTLYC